MNVDVYDLNGKPVGSTKLPKVFLTPLRPDVIRKAFLSIYSYKFQPQGRDVMAGKRTTAVSWGPGHGVARVPRIKGSGYPAGGKAAFAPMTVGGRRAHPPVSTKNIIKLINKKEKLLALKSSIAATADANLVKRRGHIFDENKKLPIIVVSDIEHVSTAKEMREFFKNIGVWEDILRVKERKRVRSGKGKMRGRKYKKAIGPLIIINSDQGISAAASNFLGVDVVNIDNLSVIHLAPGGTPGRLTIWSEAALKRLNERF
ncbi:MAG: 50S ribosomal protein L4 [Candidatus Asgardarchaeia archaeon]